MKAKTDMSSTTSADRYNKEGTAKSVQSLWAEAPLTLIKLSAEFVIGQ